MSQPSYSQVDTDAYFGSDEGLKPDEWVETFPLNRQLQQWIDPTEWGLPPLDASTEEVYAVASRLSRLREEMMTTLRTRIPDLPQDGVYCPVCHIANTMLERLHTPCPQCGRPLLQYGWD